MNKNKLQGVLYLFALLPCTVFSSEPSIDETVAFLGKMLDPKNVIYTTRASGSNSFEGTYSNKPRINFYTEGERDCWMKIEQYFLDYSNSDQLGEIAKTIHTFDMSTTNISHIEEGQFRLEDEFGFKRVLYKRYESDGGDVYYKYDYKLENIFEDIEEKMDALDFSLLYDESISSTNYIWLNFNSEVSQEKFRKAFIHLNKLCKVKHSDTDPF